MAPKKVAARAKTADALGGGEKITESLDRHSDTIYDPRDLRSIASAESSDTLIGWGQSEKPAQSEKANKVLPKASPVAKLNPFVKAKAQAFGKAKAKAKPKGYAYVPPPFSPDGGLQRCQTPTGGTTNPNDAVDAEHRQHATSDAALGRQLARQNQEAVEKKHKNAKSALHARKYTDSEKKAVSFPDDRILPAATRENPKPTPVRATELPLEVAIPPHHRSRYKWFTEFYLAIPEYDSEKDRCCCMEDF